MALGYSSPGHCPYLSRMARCICARRSLGRQGCSPIATQLPPFLLLFSEGLAALGCSASAPRLIFSCGVSANYSLRLHWASTIWLLRSLCRLWPAFPLSLCLSPLSCSSCRCSLVSMGYSEAVDASMSLAPLDFCSRRLDSTVPPRFCRMADIFPL